jgi:hypothetical protein
MQVPGMVLAFWVVDEKYRLEQVSRQEQAVVTFDDWERAILPSARRLLCHRVRGWASGCA